MLLYLLYIFSVCACAEPRAREHVLNLPYVKQQYLTSGITLLAPNLPWAERNTWSKLTAYDTDRLVLELLSAYCLWQTKERKDLQQLHSLLNFCAHVFAIASSASSMYSAELKADQFPRFLTTKRSCNWELADYWRECELRANFFILDYLIGPWLI